MKLYQEWARQEALPSNNFVFPFKDDIGEAVNQAVLEVLAEIESKATMSVNGWKIVKLSDIKEIERRYK